MIETEMEIPSADGSIPVFAAHPDEGGPFPIVIFYMDALGIREELRDMVRRIATVGYYVMLPNLFYRWGGPSFDPAPLAEGVVDPKMVELNDRLSTAMTVRDTCALLEYAARKPVVGSAAAAIGYCMGGRHAIAAAAARPDTFTAFASMHGGRLVTDRADSPHRQIRSTRGEAYFGWADGDSLAPAEHMREIEAELSARGGAWRIELHPGALHGFTFPERYCYDKGAAERVWARLFALFSRNLNRTSSPTEGKKA